MDSLKAATGGLSGGAQQQQQQQSGEEPLAGQKGPGTVEEPFDQGNAEGEFFFFFFFFFFFCSFFIIGGFNGYNSV